MTGLALARKASCVAALLAISLCAVPRLGFAAGAATEAVFTDYTPLSSNLELAHRMLSPLKAAELPKLLAQSGRGLREQPIDLAQEKFLLYVPAQQPPDGYGLFVFVPPWRDARLPDGWDGVMDQYGMIFVSAAQSGNDANPIARREPLALLAEANVARRYKIDPERVYVGGFSGGSRIAMRLALAYPDVFRGAILNAGSDPIGTPTTPLPAKELFDAFQSHSRFVYVTGEQDISTLSADAASMRSMKDWCAFNVENFVTPDASHESANPSALSRAFGALTAPISPDDRFASCRAGIEAGLAGEMQKTEALVASGKRDDARKLLTDIDARYGGLAAPKSVELEAELDGAPQVPTGR